MPLTVDKDVLIPVPVCSLFRLSRTVIIFVLLRQFCLNQVLSELLLFRIFSVKVTSCRVCLPFLLRPVA